MAIFPGSAIPSAVSDYEIDNSLRFDNATDPQLTRTFTADGNRRTWTFSCWLKTSNVDVANDEAHIWSAFDGSGGYYDYIRFNNLNDGVLKWTIAESDNGGIEGALVPTQVFRDPGAWYHMIFAFDSTAAATNRMRMYVNGVEVTDFSTDTNPDADFQCNNINTQCRHRVGSSAYPASPTDGSMDGYMAEVYFIDGTQLAPSSFGELDSDTNQWKPLDSDTVKDAVTFGTNGFYQKYNSTELAASFEDSSPLTSPTITFVPTESITADILVVAGGGGGGGLQGGGGGAGGMQALTGQSLTAITYDIGVGSGGEGGANTGATADKQGKNGFDSSISGADITTITSTGGGGGATEGQDGSDGGSGGGTSYSNGTTPGSGVSGQGYAGGDGYSAASNWPTGGGGGAGEVGGGATSGSDPGGDGGDGLQNAYRTGVNTYYAGGGGGNGYNTGNDGSGGSGGGGAGVSGSPGGDGQGIDGTSNTGGGGGGGGAESGLGGDGGSGIIVIRYLASSAKASGGTITTYGSGGSQYYVHSFTTTNVRDRHTITAVGSAKNVRSVGNFECDYLVVAGGGGGGQERGGGGGAGGFRTGTTNLYNGVGYAITVGAGGAGSAVSANHGADGGDSKLGNLITSTGGGGAGARSANTGRNGGSGGGGGSAYGGANPGGSGNTPSTSPAQGTNGGAGGSTGGTSDGSGGGGGGATSVGTAGSGDTGGAGGAGTSNSITGAAVTYSGGGGGGSANSTTASGGAGGGGTGGNNASTNATDATDNTGGGGGGGGTGGGNGSGDGGSGVVIIRYKSATNLATGGTITTDGDYKVHSFTTSGTFTVTSATRPGTSSIEFDGSGDYLSTAASSDWNFGTDGFTVEFWANGDSNTTRRESFTLGAGSNNINFDFNESSSPIWVYWGSDGSAVAAQRITPSGSAGDYTDGAWRHFALVRNGTTVTLYVNGVSVGSQTGYSAALDCSASGVQIGRMTSSGVADWLGYMDEVRISNTARYTGTFTPSTTQFTADANTKLLIHSDWTGGLGADSSGNFNNFAATNLVATDQMIDTPTNNFPTWNPLNRRKTGSEVTALSEGNLKGASYNSGLNDVASTMAMSTGKWYAEHYINTLGSSQQYWVGITESSFLAGNTMEAAGVSSVYKLMAYALKRVNNTNSTYGSALVAGDILGIAYNGDDNEVTFYKNNATMGAISCDADEYVFTVGRGDGAPIWVGNFGQDSSFAGAVTAQGNQDDNGKGDFYYAPPSGFLALCTDNLPDPEIKLPGEYFNILPYTANDATLSKTGLGFQPDFCWFKNIGNTNRHALFDVARGATKTLAANGNYAELTIADMLTSFDSDGWTIGEDDGMYGVNYVSASAFVSWNWKAGGAPTADNSAGAGATPTAGSVKIDGSNLGSALAGTIPATRLSANTTSGFSIIKYTGDGNGNATFAHGLSTSPDLVVIKNIDDTKGWMVWSPTFGSSGGDCTYLMSWEGSGGPANWCEDTIRLSGTTMVQIASSSGGSTFAWVNQSGVDYIAYCWNNIEGYSKRGTYQGNGNADGPFIYTGFRPAYLWLKGSGSSQHWHQFDNEQYPYNQTSNTTTTGVVLDEATNTGGGGGEGMGPIDILSNGFKARANNGNGNDSSTTFTYLAFAESPFKYSNAR